MPAVIHHNAHKDGRKKVREEWWDRIYFNTYQRSLYTAHISEPALAIAYSGYTEDSRREYWPSERWKGGGRDPSMQSEDSNSWVRFEDICSEYHEEVFRDGNGPWVDPMD